MSSAYVPRHAPPPRLSPVAVLLAMADAAVLAVAFLAVILACIALNRTPPAALSSPQAAASAPASAHSGTSTPASHAAPRPRPQPLAQYAVRPGDSLWAIALHHYGSGAGWERIWTANRTVIGSDPGHIVPGQVLIIPRR